MHRIEVNVRTGEQKRIEFTPSEVADAQMRTAAEAAEKAARPPKLSVEDRLAAIEAKLK